MPEIVPVVPLDSILPLRDVHVDGGGFITLPSHAPAEPAAPVPGPVVISRQPLDNAPEPDEEDLRVPRPVEPPALNAPSVVDTSGQVSKGVKSMGPVSSSATIGGSNANSQAPQQGSPSPLRRFLLCFFVCALLFASAMVRAVTHTSS